MRPFVGLSRSRVKEPQIVCVWTHHEGLWWVTSRSLSFFVGQVVLLPYCQSVNIGTLCGSHRSWKIKSVWGLIYYDFNEEISCSVFLCLNSLGRSAVISINKNRKELSYVLAPRAVPPSLWNKHPSSFSRSVPQVFLESNIYASWKINNFWVRCTSVRSFNMKFETNFVSYKILISY